MAARKKRTLPDPVQLATELGSSGAAESIVGGEWEEHASLDEEERLHRCCGERWDFADEAKIKAAIKKQRGNLSQLEACFEAHQKAFLDEISAWERSGKKSEDWEWSMA